MGIFSKKKSKIEWTEETAPKDLKIQFSIDLSLTGISKTDSYGSNVNISKVKCEKYLNLCTDSNREDIKQEIQDKLENVYLELCELIDSNKVNFSDEFWYNKSLQNKE